MGIVNGIAIVNNLIAGTLSGAALQTYLGTGSNLASFVQAINSRSQARALVERGPAVTALVASSIASAAVTESSVALPILVGNKRAWAAFLASYSATGGMAANVGSMDMVAASSTAMAAVAASSTAMASVIASSTAMAAVAASSTAMAAVAASSTAMAAVAASSTAKMAFYNSDTALNALVASGTAMTALRGAGAQYAVHGPFTATGSAVTITGPNAAGSYILLGVSSTNAGWSGQTISVATRRSGSSIANTGLTVGAANASNAQTTTNAIPIATPFTFTSSNGTGYSWYFGMLRCDV